MVMYECERKRSWYFPSFFASRMVKPVPVAPGRIALCGKFSLSAPLWSVMMMEIKHHPVRVVSPASFYSP